LCYRRGRIARSGSAFRYSKALERIAHVSHEPKQKGQLERLSIERVHDGIVAEIVQALNVRTPIGVMREFDAAKADLVDVGKKREHSAERGRLNVRQIHLYFFLDVASSTFFRFGGVIVRRIYIKVSEGPALFHLLQKRGPMNLDRSKNRIGVSGGRGQRKRRDYRGSTGGAGQSWRGGSVW
jgi:hypothetical protein